MNPRGLDSTALESRSFPTGCVFSGEMNSKSKLNWKLGLEGI